MKIKDTLIVTLCDFSRHVDFPTFWHKRRQFIRDLNPQRCYYWTDKQKLLFEVIETWIDIEDGVIPECEWTFDIKKNIIKEESNSLEIVGFKDKSKIQLNILYDNKYHERILVLTENNPYRYVGIMALCELIEREIELKEIELAYAEVDMGSPIIEVLAGTSSYLKKYSSENNDLITVKKIEVIGDNESPAEIYINDIKQAELFSGECAYVTFKGDGFIQILLNKIEKGNNLLTLSNKSGQYISSLVVEDTESGKIITYEGVTSFTLGERGGYAYIENGKLKSRWKDRDIYYLLEPFDVPILVTSNDADHIFVLMNNGTVKSTIAQGIFKKDIVSLLTNSGTGEISFQSEHL